MEFKTTKEIIKEIGLFKFLKTRIVSPRQIIEEYRKEEKYFERGSQLKDAIFFARYD